MPEADRPKPTQIDWERGERMIRAGQLSLREISRILGCSDRAVRKRMETRGITRDLSRQVRRVVRGKLTADGLRELRASAEGEPVPVREDAVDEDLAIREAAAIGVEVVRSHRRDIATLHRVEQALLRELGDTDNPPRKLYITQNRGVIIEKEVAIAVTDRASALQALAAAAHKRIQLERQAFSLDDSAGNDDPELPQVIERVIVYPGADDGGTQ